MKKTLLTLLVLVMAMAMQAQQVSGVAIGYCSGQAPTRGVVSSAQKNVWRSAAIHVDRNLMATFADCHIDSIRAGLASKLNVDSLVVWLRTSLDGENIAQGAISKTDLKKGWNLVALDTPYNIPAKLDDGLYIGFSFHQKSSSTGFAVVTSDHSEGGFYLKEQDGEWEDMSLKGVLSVEALAYGDKLPKVNLSLKEITVQPIYAISNGKLKVQATVKNLATMTISGFKFRCSVDGYDGTYDIAQECSLGYQDEQIYSFVVDNPNVGTPDNVARTINIQIADINEGEDENTSDNTLSAQFEVIAQDFTRNVLIEEFTTEKCPNCPRMASYIKTLLGNEDYAERVNVITRHAGYYTDWLTATCDDDYLWFYNAGGSTYAPAVMFDRTVMDEGTTPVYCPSSQDQFNTMVDYALEKPAYVSLKLSVTPDESNPYLLHVNVKGSRSKADITSLPARINVVALEDDITAQNQAGASGSYIHEHVNRGFNSTWGDEIEWNGDDYDYSTDITIKNDCKVENMQVVAYISNYDSDDATNCQVANSARSEYKDWITTGIEGIKTSNTNTSATHYYDLSGKLLSGKPAGKGVYVMKQGNITKKIVLE